MNWDGLSCVSPDVARAIRGIGTPGDPLLARLRQVHERPRFDIDPALKVEDPKAYQLALWEACR